MQTFTIISMTGFTIVGLIAFATATGMLIATRLGTAGIWLWCAILTMAGYIALTYLVGMYRAAYGLPYFFWEWAPPSGGA